MGQYCKNCKKMLKNSEMTHCSDECLLASVKDSKSLDEYGINAVTWDDKSDPWI